MWMVQTRRNFFYKRISVGPTAFTNKPQIEIPFTATHIIISNDSTNNDVGFSFLKPALDGELFKNNAPITFDGVSVTKVWFMKLANGQNPSVRIWAWRL